MRTKGFIAGPLLFGLALLMSVMGFYAYSTSNSGSAFSVSDFINGQSTKVKTAQIVNQGADLAQEFSKVVAEGASGSALSLGSLTSRIGEQKVPSSICANPSGCKWSINRSISLPGVGGAKKDAIIFISGITLAAAEEINKQVNNIEGDGLGGAIAQITTPVADLESNSATELKLSSVGVIKNESVLTVSNTYIYYKVISEDTDYPQDSSAGQYVDITPNAACKNQQFMSPEATGICQANAWIAANPGYSFVYNCAVDSCNFHRKT